MVTIFGRMHNLLLVFATDCTKAQIFPEDLKFSLIIVQKNKSNITFYRNFPPKFLI